MQSRIHPSSIPSLLCSRPPLSLPLPRFPSVIAVAPSPHAEFEGQPSLSAVLELLQVLPAAQSPLCAHDGCRIRCGFIVLGICCVSAV